MAKTECPHCKRTIEAGVIPNFCPYCQKRLDPDAVPNITHIRTTL